MPRRKSKNPTFALCRRMRHSLRSDLDDCVVRTLNIKAQRSPLRKLYCPHEVSDEQPFFAVLQRSIMILVWSQQEIINKTIGSRIKGDESGS